MASRPNVLFITLDQFRGGALSTLGHPVARTPHLDALARRGVLFARHYSQAAPCAPGRAALYTGTYQMTNRVVFNGTPLDDRFDNVAKVARRAGYAPTLFGYTDQAIDPRTVTDPDDPRLGTYEGVLPGFEVELDLTEPRSAWNEHVARAGFEVTDDPDRMLATEPDRPAEFGVSAFLTDRFVDWLDRQDGPWFAHLSHLRPHPPYAAAGHWSEAFDPDEVDLPVAPSDERHHLHDALLGIPDVAAPTDEVAIRRLRAQYYGMVADVDHEVGRTMAALAARGLADNTVVIVTSDHGDLLGDHGLLGKFGWHEEAFHIPAIVVDPRRQAGHGTVVDAPTENVDLLPTLCDLLGVDTPDQCDGHSLSGFLDGPSGDSWDSTASLWRTGAVWEFDWRAVAIMAGHVPTRLDPLTTPMHLAVWRSADTAYVQFGDGSWLCADVGADPTWRTAVDDVDRVFAAARHLLTWRSRHLDRILADTVLHGVPLGRPPGR